jgi:hypothetical protein
LLIFNLGDTYVISVNTSGGKTGKFEEKNGKLHPDHEIVCCGTSRYQMYITKEVQI